jgi:probable addiction module antidote protein
MSKNTASAAYEAVLLEDLKDPAEAAAYLEAALEDNDPSVFLLALRQVAQAQGMANVARKAHVGRESLYKALSENGPARRLGWVRPVPTIQSRHAKPVGVRIRSPQPTCYMRNVA